MSGHRVEWKLDGDTIFGEIICDEPEGAYCLMGCPEGCESGAWCDHDPVDTGECLAAEWIGNSGQLEEFHQAAVDMHPVCDGPVVIWWDGRDENWLWRYEDEQAAE